MIPIARLITDETAPDQAESMLLLSKFLSDQTKLKSVSSGKTLFSFEVEEHERMKKLLPLCPPNELFTFEGDSKLGYTPDSKIELPTTGLVNFGRNGYGALFVYDDGEEWDENVDVVFFRRLFKRPSYIKVLTPGTLYKVVRVGISEHHGSMTTGATTTFFTVDEVTGRVYDVQDDRIERETKKKPAALAFQRSSRVMLFESMRLLMDYSNWVQITTGSEDLAIRTHGDKRLYDTCFTKENLPKFATEGKTEEEINELLEQNIKNGVDISLSDAVIFHVDLGPTATDPKVLAHQHAGDSSMNPSKFDKQLKSHTNVAQKVFACLQPDTDYTMTSIYALVRKEGNTTHNQRSIKAATLDLVDSGLIIKQGESLRKVKVTYPQPEAPKVAVKSAPKPEVVKTQHASKSSTPSIKPKAPIATPVIPSKKEIQKQVLASLGVTKPQVTSVLPADWVGSFIHGQQTSYDPLTKDFVVEHVYESGLYKHNMVRASTIGDVIRYPTPKPKSLRDAYATFGNVMHNAAHAANLGMEIHVFKTYVDVLMVPIERMSLRAEYIESRGQMEEILKNTVPVDLKMGEMPTNAEGWLVSATTTNVTHYKPLDMQVSIARGMLGEMQSYCDLNTAKPGDTIRYRRDSSWTAEVTFQRFGYALRTYGAKLGVHLEAHAFRDYVDIFVTNIRVTSDRPLQLKAHYVVAPMDLQLETKDVVVQSAPVSVDVGANEVVATPVATAPAPVTTQDVVVEDVVPQGANTAPALGQVSPQDTALWETTFTKLLDQGVDSDDAIARATRAVDALRGLRVK